MTAIIWPKKRRSGTKDDTKLLAANCSVRYYSHIHKDVDHNINLDSDGF
jgi:hypothetical protein